jgi:hypothetical protein
MDFTLLGSMTRGRIVHSARVTCHRQIPVIQRTPAGYDSRSESSVRDLTPSLRNALRR